MIGDATEFFVAAIFRIKLLESVADEITGYNLCSTTEFSSRWGCHGQLAQNELPTLPTVTSVTGFSTEQFAARLEKRLIGCNNLCWVLQPCPSYNYPFNSIPHNYTMGSLADQVILSRREDVATYALYSLVKDTILTGLPSKFTAAWGCSKKWMCTTARKRLNLRSNGQTSDQSDKS